MDSRMTMTTGEDAPYWQGLNDGKLLLPQCSDCHSWRWPAGHRCGTCLAIGMTWVEQEMKGTIFSWTRTWHRFGMTEGFDLPYTNIVAQIDGCAIRLMGLLDDPAQIDPRIGEPVSGRIGRTAVGERSLPVIIWSRDQ
jgi:hypothetical protein